MLEKKKRNKLKEQLLEEAKKDQYILKLKDHIKALTVMEEKYKTLALKGKEESDALTMERGIKHHQFLRNSRAKLEDMLSYIETFTINQDMSAIHKDFLVILNDFTEDLAKTKEKPHKTKKVLKKHKRQVRKMSDYFAHIDQRMHSITQEMINIKETKPLSQEAIDQYFEGLK